MVILHIAIDGEQMLILIINGLNIYFRKSFAYIGPSMIEKKISFILNLGLSFSFLFLFILGVFIVTISIPLKLEQQICPLYFSWLSFYFLKCVSFYSIRAKKGNKSKFAKRTPNHW